MAFDPARVKSLFLEASDLPSPEGRGAYLDRECGGEPDLRARVEVLLAAEDLAGPVPDPEAAGVSDLTQAQAVEATRMFASEDLSESRVSDPDAGLATVGATGVGGGHGTLAEAPSAVRIAGFVPGRVIAGRYTLLEVLGEGGMGTVYKAEQSQPVKRQVALKLIKVGMDSRTVLARFDAERQALAMMDHPNIARVYDGGATEAHQPFFVMEFVQGVAITDYCDQHHLTVDARLQLFVAACQAVQHAHQKGIIHRDLKPSNVMVTEVDGRPTPKVIDFGVAKATGASLTDQSLGDTGAIVGTPTHMSPEQADPSSMDIDTRTDVYALGVILYELLAGSPPLDAVQFKRGALLEMLRMVREVDPSKPSTKVSTAEALPGIAANRGIDPERLKRALRGDLDWIVMKALEKDRTRRYETANGFGADILRHLASEPVLAAPPSRSYRVRKFVRKHRAALLTTAAFATLLLLAAVVSTWQAIRATRAEWAARQAEAEARQERDGALAARQAESQARLRAEEAERSARSEADKAKAVNDFLTEDLLTQAEPAHTAAEDHITLLEVLDRAAAKVGDRFAGQPEVEDALRRSIARTYHGLASWEKAERQWRAVLAEARRRLGGESHEALVAQGELVHILRHRGRLDAELLEMARSASDGLARVLGPGHPDTLLSRDNLANAYLAAGRTTEAITLLEATLKLEESKLGHDHPFTLAGRHTLASAYLAAGRNVEAIALHEANLKLCESKLGPDHPATLSSRSNLAVAYDDADRIAEAIALNEANLKLRESKLGSDHPDTLQTRSNLAANYFQVGRTAEAIALSEVGIKRSESKLGPDHPDTLNSRNNLAQYYSHTRRIAEAIVLHEANLKLFESKLGREHPETLNSRSNLAEAYGSAGRTAEAIALLEPTVKQDQSQLGPDHPYTLKATDSLVRAYLASKRWTEAERLSRQYLAGRDQARPDDWRTFSTRSQLGKALLGQGRYAEAEPLVVAGYEGLKARENRIPWQAKPRVHEAAERVIRLYEAWGKPEQAAAWKAKLGRAELPADPFHPWVVPIPSCPLGTADYARSNRPLGRSAMGSKKGTLAQVFAAAE